MQHINWILYAPQYHFFMGVVGVSCLALLIWCVVLLKQCIVLLKRLLNK